MFEIGAGVTLGVVASVASPAVLLTLMLWTAGIVVLLIGVLFPVLFLVLLVPVVLVVSLLCCRVTRLIEGAVVNWAVALTAISMFLCLMQCPSVLMFVPLRKVLQLVFLFGSISMRKCERLACFSWSLWTSAMGRLNLCLTRQCV